MKHSKDFNAHKGAVRGIASAFMSGAYPGKVIPKGFKQIPSEFKCPDHFYLDKALWNDLTVELAFINWEVELRNGNFLSCGGYVLFGGCLADAIHRVKPIKFIDSCAYSKDEVNEFNNLFALDYGWCFAFIMTRLHQIFQTTGAKRPIAAADFPMALLRLRRALPRSDEMFAKVQRTRAMQYEEVTLFYDFLLNT